MTIKAPGETYTGMTFVLVDDEGRELKRVEWQEAADRIVRRSCGDDEPDAYAYAMAHRMLDTMLGGVR